MHSSPDIPIKITSDVFLGSFNAAEYNNLQRNNIKSILCLTQDCHNYNDNSLTVYHIDSISESLAADTFTLDKLIAAVEFIEQQIGEHKKVLVHCRAGVSRSPTVIIAFLMKHNKLSATDAQTVLHKIASHINPTFDDLLKQYEYYLKTNF